MNILYFLTPKAEVSYLRRNMTLRQALERMRNGGFTAVPVIDNQDRYVGVVSEGDFLWDILDHNMRLDGITMKSLEDMTLGELVEKSKSRIRAVRIDTDMEELLLQMQNQNFVPVIDDRSVFIGIVTRRDVISYFVNRYLQEKTEA